MLKIFKVFLKVVEWIFSVFLLCILFIVISPKLPIKNLPKSFVVVSGSMEPTIKTGSVAFTRDVDLKTIKTGDIIAFTSPSDPKDTILHRVNSISSTNPLLFKTKGDNNNDIDAWDVMDVGVKGVYFFAIPYLGTIAAALRQPLGFALIVGIPAFIFILGQIFSIKKAINEEINRKVSQKLKESESKKSKDTTLKSILFFLLFSASIFGLNNLNTAKALYSDSVTISGITLTVADFTKPPIPTLVSPENNIIKPTKDLIMDWSTVVNPLNPSSLVFYVYQSSRFADFSTTAGYRGYLLDSQVPAPGTPNGVYYWRVKACYTDDNCSEWTNPWSVTIDSTLPTSTITLPVSSGTISEITPQLTNWDGQITGTAADNFSGVDHVELSIYSSDSNKYWNGSAWIDGTELTTRVTAQETNNWSYQITPTSLFNGTFKIVSHAVDKAGNVENSATIEFEYVSTSVENIVNQTPISATNINLLSNHSGNKINLEITNILIPLDYEILYTGNGIEKGIFGHINLEEIVDSKYSKDFYLGTCSTGGTCTPEAIESGSIITVNLTGGATLTKTFNY